MPKSALQQELKATITRMAGEQANPQKLFEAARKDYPKATKSEIIRAAFAAMIETAETDIGRAKSLQNTALELRRDALPDPTAKWPRSDL